MLFLVAAMAAEMERDEIRRSHGVVVDVEPDRRRKVTRSAWLLNGRCGATISTSRRGCSQ